jgi:hypothetical protein
MTKNILLRCNLAGFAGVESEPVPANGPVCSGGIEGLSVD